MNVTSTHIPTSQLRPGHNVDPVDFAEGLAFARQLGYDTPTHQMELEYNLMRWARGEEGPADHSMSKSLSGVSYTDWRAVLAHAIATTHRPPMGMTTHPRSASESPPPTAAEMIAELSKLDP